MISPIPCANSLELLPGFISSESRNLLTVLFRWVFMLSMLLWTAWLSLPAILLKLLPGFISSESRNLLTVLFRWVFMLSMLLWTAWLSLPAILLPALAISVMGP